MTDLGHVHFTGVERPLPPRRRPALPCPTVRPPDGEDAIEPFVAALFAARGLDAAAYGPASLRRRTLACLRELRVSSGDAAAALLRERPDLEARALSALLVGVSGFFRDERVFEGLGALLPTLAAERGGVRACSVGVSDGRELYSVAMLLDEAGLLGGSRLLGVDCRADVLARGRAGRYRPDELGGVSPERLARHFVASDDGHVVRPSLAQRLEWRVGTVSAPAADAPWDLLLFRNVSIYFRADAAARAWHVVAECLAPGGVVVTGTAERPPAGSALRQVAPCAWRREA